MTTANTSATLKNRAGLRWALVPVGLLLTSTLGVGWMAAVAIHDPNFALEHDYYQKAIHWDVTQTQAGENHRLAYQFSVPPTIRFDRMGNATLEIRVSDRTGLPVAGAHISALGFANAYSDEVSRLTLSERAPGVYSAVLTAHHAGLWEFRLSMDSGAEHATAIVRCDLIPGGAA